MCVLMSDGSVFVYLSCLGDRRFCVRNGSVLSCICLCVCVFVC
jgi:hypothetical protein